MPGRIPVFRPHFLGPRLGSPDYRRQHDAQRGSAAARGYDADWQRKRASYLAAHPTCSAPGCGMPATNVDHIKSVRTHPELRLADDNLRGFCARHDAAQTARRQGFGRGGE